MSLNRSLDRQVIEDSSQSPYNGGINSPSLHRQNTSPRNQMILNRNMNSQIYEDLPQPPYNGGIHSPNQLLSLYMNLMSAQNPLFSSQGSSPNSFVSPHQANSPNSFVSPHQ